MLRAPTPSFPIAKQDSHEPTQATLPPPYVPRDAHPTAHDWLRQVEAISAACKADPSRLLTTDAVLAAIAAERAATPPAR